VKIVALVGSIRKDSYNLKIVKTIQERFADKVELVTADIAVLPYYNQDDEHNPSEVVQAFKQQIADADAVIIATPEYNWSIPGVLKNALDWLSRVDKVMTNKPVLIIGATMGMLGTIRAQLHLREILAGPGISARIMPLAGTEVLIAGVHNKIDSNGRLADESTLAHLDDVVSKFIKWAK
jgi:chromate reductase, NAD(P)H dehydrogenase (quinone)